MALSTEGDLWKSIIHLFVVLFDHILFKYLFYALVCIVFALIFLKKRSFGDEPPTRNDAEQATQKLLKIIEKLLIVIAIAFVLIQLIRIYFIK
jgi:hypothetical protein